MAASGTHTQVYLQKGNSFTTSWIPSQFAKKNTYIKIKGSKMRGMKDGEEWSDGWKIIAVYATWDAEEVLERSRDYTHQREYSDI